MEIQKTNSGTMNGRNLKRKTDGVSGRIELFVRTVLDITLTD
jgi:hypothetical protein